jgi:hypothetical protein
MRAKKRRLLQKVDWAGISLQKPLTIEYPQPRKRIQQSYGSRNLHKIVNLGASKATPSKSSTSDEIRVCVGSQNFR